MSALKTGWKKGDYYHDLEHDEITRRLLDVRDYGAVVDGVTDDSAALQAMVEDTAVSSLVLPAGEIALATPVTITVGQLNAIRGQGVDKTILKPTTTAFILDTQTVEADAIANVHLSDFTIQGGTVGIQATGAQPLSKLIMERVHFLNQTSKGFYSDCELVNSTFRNCKASGAYNGSAGVSPDYGFHLGGNYVHFSLSFYDCEFSNSLLGGIYFDNSGGTGGSAEIRLINCLFESNWRYGLRANRIKSLSIWGGYVEANSREAQGYADILLEQAGVDYDTDYVSISDVGGSYDLGRPQPQVFLDTADGIDHLLLVNNRVAGYEVHHGLSPVTTIHTAATMVGGGTVTALA